MPGSASMTWQVVYNHRGAIALKLVKGEASAVDAACDILDAGGEIYRIETTGTLIAIQAEHLRKIWNERKLAGPGRDLRPGGSPIPPVSTSK
jgi:hypothetical protein